MNKGIPTSNLLGIIMACAAIGVEPPWTRPPVVIKEKQMGKFCGQCGGLTASKEPPNGCKCDGQDHR